MASLLRLALSFEMFSLVNSNFKKAPPPPQEINCILTLFRQELYFPDVEVGNH